MSISRESLYLFLEDTIVNGVRHPNYDRTVKLARKYKMLITGEDFDELLLQFVRREDQEMFSQRKRITQPITPAVISAVMNPFFKVGRNNNIKIQVDFKSASEQKAARMKTVRAEYWGTKSLDQYLETRFTQLSFSDPNAFIVTEFDQVPDARGVMNEIPKPRSFEVYSENAINYLYVNNVLQFLIVQLPVSYKKKDGSKVHGFSYTIYGPEHSIKFTQVSVDMFSPLPSVGGYVDLVDSKLFRATEKDVFIVEEFNHRSKLVPAEIVGYKLDPYTNGTSYVAPFHDAMPYLMKSVKTVSEHDLSMCLHAFPQKFAYGPRCMGESELLTCDGGLTPTGGECKKCKGTGVTIHTTAQDAIIMRLPRDKEEMIDLSKMVYYVSPSIDLIKYQNDYTLQLTEQVRQAVFNSEIFSKTEVTATATEKQINMESVYDTIFPYACKYSEMFVHTMQASSYYVDIPDAVIIHKFPKDLKFKTVDQLLFELKTANEGGAPGYIRKEISNDIAEVQFIDKPDELNRIRVKSSFFPFSDKTETEIIYIISNGETTKELKTLWSHFDIIFTEIEKDEDTREVFYLMPYRKQKEIVDKKVGELIAKMESQQPSILGFSETDNTIDDTGADITTPVDVEAEAKAKLKGSVGGVQGILEIQKSVAEGTTEYSAAIALLFEIFGFDESTAKSILGNPKPIKTSGNNFPA